MIPYTIGKSGLHAQQEAMNITANDLANLNTTGYKGKNIAFRELMTNAVTEKDVQLSGNAGNPVISRGVKGAAVANDTGQGSFISSDAPFHLAIAGEGFFGVQTPDGLRLTRDGAFSLNGAGTLVNDQGEAVDATFFVPQNQWPAGNVSVLDSGEIRVESENGNTLVGQINVYIPADPSTLQPAGKNQFVSPAGVILTRGGEGGAGTIQQHLLETSNVDLAQTMIQLMTAQRAYSFNLKTIQTTDDLYSMINQFNRS